MAEIRRPSQSGKAGLSMRILLVALVLLLSGCLRQGVYHEVKPGQTLYRISKTYKVEEAYLARINGIPSPKRLRVGTRLFIPDATHTLYVPATVPRPKTETLSNTTPQTKIASGPTKTASVRKPAQKSAPGLKNATKPKLVNTKPSKPNVKMDWPLRGKILRAFGQSGKGGGKGVEIAAQEGSKVTAAAAGKVIYSGDGVRGFGHLMILQHENDVFTVYGFNSLNHVKQGQFVSQGERIASSGRPPSGESARLHFEVRVGKQAVNPILYLP